MQIYRRAVERGVQNQLLGRPWLAQKRFARYKRRLSNNLIPDVSCEVDSTSIDFQAVTIASMFHGVWFEFRKKKAGSFKFNSNDAGGNKYI